MKQSPRYFFGYLSKKLQAQGLQPPNHDPCLFLGNTEWQDPTAKSTVTILAHPVDTAPGGASSDKAIHAPGGAHNKDGPALNTRSQVNSDEFEPSSFAAARIWGQPPALIANLGHSVPSKFHGENKLTKAYVAAQPIFKDQWDDVNELDFCGFLTAKRLLASKPSICGGSLSSSR